MNGMHLLAYIDPGSGTLLLQVILASVLGGVYSARAWIAGLWASRPGKQP
jgi:hypothetical protein